MVRATVERTSSVWGASAFGREQQFSGQATVCSPYFLWHSLQDLVVCSPRRQASAPTMGGLRVGPNPPPLPFRTPPPPHQHRR